MQRRSLLASGCSLLLGCAARGSESRAPVAESAARSVLSPVRLGWLSSRQTTGELPSAVGLGGESSGRVLLFFEFAAQIEPRRLLRAELLLDTEGAPGHGIDVELSRAEPARAELRQWSDQPRALYPRLQARLSAEALLPARLDVTELLHAEQPGVPLRVLLRAEPHAPEPVLVVTGARGGMAPALEVYWQ